MPLTVKDLIEVLKDLPQNAFIRDLDNEDFAISEVFYDEEEDDCFVSFEEVEEGWNMNKTKAKKKSNLTYSCKYRWLMRTCPDKQCKDCDYYNEQKGCQHPTYPGEVYDKKRS